MEGMIKASIKTLDEMKLSLPPAAFQHSFGLVILEAIQVGFIITAGVGTGILIRHDKKNKTWSHPIAVGLSNLGAGLVAGLQRKHMVIFITERQMMGAMASDFSFRLGMHSNLTVGTLGEEFDITAHIGTKGSGTTSGYTKTKGLYVGAELEGAALAPRKGVNEAFYGCRMAPKKVLFGQIDDVPQCEPLDELYEKLEELAVAEDRGPKYVETIARPFVKNTTDTNTIKKE